jgi:nucleotide-binding universal stress UspA family protein
VANTLSNHHQRLEDVARSLNARSIDTTALMVQGYAAECILDAATKHQAVRIVMGTHGHGMLRQLLVGSVTEGVLRDATCPVVIVPSRPGE